MKREKKNSHSLFLLLFALLLYLPASLWGLRLGTGKLFDVPLLGFTDDTPRPALSVQQMVSGEFQAQATSWVGEKMPLRGVYTKTYNTLQYYCFHQGNRIIGGNYSVFEPSYLDEALSIGSRYDLSLPENVAKLEDVVAHMASANQKLEDAGKHLYVYLAPGKAEICPEDIPAGYLPMANSGSPTALETMTALLKSTEVPCLFCAELAEDPEYPAFYPTGIHWSRTYEQRVSQRIIADLSDLTGKTYPNYVFTGVEEQRIPFSRDTDVYDLLNIWTAPKQCYYQYRTEAVPADDAVPLHAILWGDSFASGLLGDVIDPSHMYYVNRNDYVQFFNGTETVFLNKDWNNFDWQRFLDTSDVVIVEMCAPEIMNGTFGFIQALDTYLDAYTPQELGAYYPDVWDASDPSGRDASFTSGIWWDETGFSWTKGQCCLELCSEGIAQRGLEVTYAAPSQVMQSGSGDTVTVAVNGTVMSEKTYWEETDDTLVFQPESLPPAQDGIYSIVISCSKTFNPKEMGINEDARDLGIRLMYAGGAR